MQTTKNKIILSSMDWIKSKESTDLKQSGIIIDEVVDCLVRAKEKNLDLLSLLQDTFIVSALEFDGEDKDNLFDLFVMTNLIKESNNSKKVKENQK